MQFKTLFRQWRFPLFVAALLSVVFVHYFVNRAVVELEISVSQPTWFKIYWAQEGQPYSEKKMARVRAYPKQTQYSFFLTDLRKVDALRIDPHEYAGEAVIKKLDIRQKGFKPLSFDSEKEFSRLAPVFQIEGSRFSPDGLIVEASGIDPQFKYQVELQRGSPYSLQTAVCVAAIFIFIFAFFSFTENYRQETAYVPLLFTIVFILVLVMAAVSRQNSHPDEHVHLAATQYYTSNWLPPPADDPAIKNTYSVYGASRLNNFEVAYLFLGKFTRLLEPLQLSTYLRARLFNVLLLGILLFSLLKYSELRLVAMPLLLTPQIWYIFSYCDSDAFALFITFLVSWQVVLPGSMFNQWLTGKNNRQSGVKIVLFAVGCAMLFLLKKNYYFFIVFLGGYFLWRSVVYREEISPKVLFRRIGLVVVLGLCLAGVRVGISHYVNGFDRTAKIMALQEELSDPMYKPSTPLEQKHSFLYRKARGDSLETLVRVDRWFEKTFRSSVGVYGYFTVSAPFIYYTVVRWLGVVLAAYCILFVFLRGGISGNILLAFFLSCVAGLIGASLYHSWASDFQAQGRYLVPIIPMLSIMIYHIRPFLPSPGYRLLQVSLFFTSVYSFVFIALMNIPKG